MAKSKSPSQRRIEAGTRNVLKHQKPWKKGQSGNPHGSSGKSRARADIKRLTQEEFEIVVATVMKNNKAELKRIAQDPSVPFLQHWIARCALKANSDSSAYLLWPMLDRILGKAKESIQVTTPGGAPQILVTLPDNGRSAKPDEPKGG